MLQSFDELVCSFERAIYTLAMFLAWCIPGKTHRWAKGRFRKEREVVTWPENAARDEAVLWGSAAVAAGLRHQQLAQMSAATVAQNQERLYQMSAAEHSGKALSGLPSGGFLSPRPVMCKNTLTKNPETP